MEKDGTKKTLPELWIETSICAVDEVCGYVVLAASSCFSSRSLDLVQDVPGAAATANQIVVSEDETLVRWKRIITRFLRTTAAVTRSS